MSDLISRQETIDAIWAHATNILENSDYPLFFQDVYKMAHRHIAELIQYLPSAEPVKHGRWKKVIHSNNNITHNCSECKSVFTKDVLTKESIISAPNCGAKMDEVEE